MYLDGVLQCLVNSATTTTITIGITIKLGARISKLQMQCTQCEEERKLKERKKMMRHNEVGK